MARQDVSACACVCMCRVISLADSEFLWSIEKYFLCCPPSLPPSSLLFFLGIQVPLQAGEPTTPTQSWPIYRGIRDGCGQGGKGSNGRKRGLLGALLSWQEVGGGGWLCHPIASPPVPWKTTVILPEMKIQPWISWTLDTRKMLVILLYLNMKPWILVLA